MSVALVCHPNHSLQSLTRILLLSGVKEKHTEKVQDGKATEVGCWYNALLTSLLSRVSTLE